jgi:hypothetical protein
MLAQKGIWYPSLTGGEVKNLDPSTMSCNPCTPPFGPTAEPLLKIGNPANFFAGMTDTKINHPTLRSPSGGE